MTIQPRSPEEITEEIQDRLTGRIRRLTNFASTSFNRVFLTTFARLVSQYELKLLSAQLSGWVEYSGRDITEQDLLELGVAVPELDRLNEFQEESHLEELGKIVGVERGDGEQATGEVTIQTASDTTQIPEGMKVGTQPTVEGEFETYLVDADGDGEITPDEGISTTPPQGATEVTVPVIAEEVGPEYNVGLGSVTFLPAPPPGVEGVVNNTAIDGGEGPQPLPELREDIQQAVVASSGGGTVAGVAGYVEQNVENVSAVQLSEEFDEDPVTVDVVVDGGSESEVSEAIEEARPAGVRHQLVRPASRQIGVSAGVAGFDVNTEDVENALTQLLSDLDLGRDVVGDRIVQIILNSSRSIQNILSRDIRLISVTNERHTYQSGTSVYQLDETRLGDLTQQQVYTDTIDVYQVDVPAIDSGSTTVTARVSGIEQQLTEGTDYAVIDSSGDGSLDAIDFSVGGVEPDNNSVVTIEYDATSVGPVELTATVSGSETTLTAGTDYEFIDADTDGYLDSVDFSVGGATPDDETDFVVSYDVQRTIEEDLPVDVRQKAVPDDTEIEVTLYEQ